MRIDVAVATKNNARTIDKCLKAIRANIPVRRLIVVDNGSTDETVNIAKKNGAEVVYQPGFLGTVRYQQALNCSTEWIAIIDSDVYVRKSWWPTVTKYIDQDDVGMVLAGIGETPGRPLVYSAYFCNTTRRHGGAVSFSNSLVRRDLMLSCRELLGTVPIEEDGIFASYLKKNRKRIVTILSPLVFHDSPRWTFVPKAYFRWGRGIRISAGLRGLKGVARVLRDNLLNDAYFLIDTRRISPALFFFLLYLWASLVAGYVTYRAKS